MVRKIDLKKVYLLQHSYEIICDDVTYDKTKIIGIYFSREKAESVVNKYIYIQGFDKYPISCFYIDEYTIDEDNWVEGFVGSDEIARDFETLTSCFNDWLGIKVNSIEESWNDSNYYHALCEVNSNIYNVKDVSELAQQIYFVWEKYYETSPIKADDCIEIATNILKALNVKFI